MLAGADLTDPKVCYNRESDSWPASRSARFVGQCASLVRPDEWLVTVTVLSTGKKVVGRTKIGPNPTTDGYLRDGRAKLYELTQKKTFSLSGDPNYAINSNRLSGPCFGKSGDFCMSDAALETGSCDVGGTFVDDAAAARRAGDDGMESVEQGTLDLCGIAKGWGIVAFQSWVVKDFNQHVLNGGDMAWLDSELPGAVISEAKICYDLATDVHRRFWQFHAGCGDMKSHALMIVAELTTNKKVVGFTLKGFNPDDGAAAAKENENENVMREDNFANLFEVTGRTRLVLEDPDRAVGSSPQGGIVFGAGPDFAVQANFKTIDCELGTSYASANPLTASALKKLLCGVHLDGGAVKLNRFEAGPH